MIRLALYATACVQDGQPILALSFHGYDGPGISCRPVGVLLAPEGSTPEDRPLGFVLVVPTPEGSVALPAIEAAQQAEVGGCGLAFAEHEANRDAN